MIGGPIESRLGHQVKPQRKGQYHATVHTNITARIGRWSTQHRKAAILGWLGFVLAALVIGMNLVPQKTLDQNASGPGERARPQRQWTAPSRTHRPSRS